MNVGLIDVDSHNFPNLPLMKISAYHKSIGDSVEFVDYFKHYDLVYSSRVFSDQYSQENNFCINADKIIFGGTGYAISIQGGVETYEKTKDVELPSEIEHIYPDYSLYEYLTKDTAYGFLTRGCPNNCPFCIVSKKEGRKSVKVADLSEFWRGQKNIKLLDPNILACKDRIDLLRQLSDSGARVDFTQGLDARLIDEETANSLKNIKINMVHFAFDLMKNEDRITRGLKLYKDIVNTNESKCICYILTNYNTTIEQDLYRVRLVRELGYYPYVMVYMKGTEPRVVKDLQRWCNNRFIYKSVDFMDYVPRKDGKSIKQLYFGG